jgi:hypothetical protein
MGVMKNQIVVDGESRLWDALRPHQARLRKSIEAKYTAQMSLANPTEKRALKKQMEHEFQVEWKKLKPSSYALYATSVPWGQSAARP